MTYDLTHLQTYLEVTSPVEIAQLLDELLFDLIVSSDCFNGDENLFKKYLGLMSLRNQFAKMDDDLKKIWK